MKSQNELLNLVNSHFRKHGYKHPPMKIAMAIGVSEQTVRNWINASANGIGFDKGQLNPYSADKIIMVSADIMDNPRSRNPVKRYLNGLIKDYNRVRMERFNA